MRKFLVTTFVTAFIVSSASFAAAQGRVAGTPGVPDFAGVITSEVTVPNTVNDVSGTGSEAEIHAGSIGSGIMGGNFITTVTVATELNNSSTGDGNEANITLGSVGE